MKWKVYQDIANALNNNAVPRGKVYDSEHSTPDVYGRAIQYYISLWEAQQINDYEGDAVRTWRGFLTLLALRDYLDLPLFWTRVDLTEEMKDRNLFYLALEHPVKRPERLLYPGNPNWIWDGKVFYALQWAPADKEPEDILLYSPYTLLYPVAGWRRKLVNISSQNTRESRNLTRFFGEDETGHYGFRVLTKPDRNYSEDSNDAPPFKGTVLNRGEPEMAYYFLSHLLETFNRRSALNESGSNETQRTISGHIKQYMQELRNNLRVVSTVVEDAFRLRPFPPAAKNPVQANWIPDILQNAVKIGEGKYFADQICYFKADKYPFTPGDAYHSCYQIANSPKQDAQWYAFLPIHPDQRRDCVSNGIARSIRMKYKGVPGQDEKIVATMTLPSGREVSMDYSIVHKPTMQPSAAVCLNETENALTQDTWPVMAVWPQKIGSDWKEYYILWDDADAGENPVELEIANLIDQTKPQKPSAQTQGDSAVKKTNRYVVKTNYVPDAIPLVKKGAGGKTVSVGMVIPPTVPTYQGLRTVVANVAVDFGTSSTRVFASVDGGPPLEIGIMGMENEPKEVILYKENQNKVADIAKNLVRPFSNLNRRENIRSEEELPDLPQDGQSFPPPEPDKDEEKRAEIRERIQGRAEQTLFSVFRKSKEGLEFEDVSPLLDGNIYQPTEKETLEDTGNLLVPNLKWDMAGKGKYYVAFMKQLLLQITVNLNGQGVKQVKWRYSLPRSMSDQNKKAMRKIWTEDMQIYLDQISGATLQHDIEPDISESVAASRYFLNRYPALVNRGKGFLVVDIGGGSTDVALWQTKNGKLSMVWQDSVQVAGQRMCTRWVEEQLNQIQGAMRNSGEEHRNVFSDLVHEMPSAKDKKKAETRTALVDRLLTYYSDEMISSFRTEWENTSNVWCLKLYEHIAQGISLMMFSLGCQVGLLYAAGRFAISEEDGYFTIALCGRGAGLMDWLERIDKMPYSQEARKWQETLIYFFHRGMAVGESLLQPGQNPQAGQVGADKLDSRLIHIIRNRDNPKCEVACGLLVTELSGEQDATGEIGRTAGALLKDYDRQAADKFREEFLRVFTGEGAQIDMPEMDRHQLASLTQKKIPASGATLNDVFRILTDVIYTYLENAPETSHTVR